MKVHYKTAISDARWIAYDIPGNVGWIAYLVCVFRGLREKRNAYNIASALPGVLMLMGVGELISEEIIKRLPKSSSKGRKGHFNIDAVSANAYNTIADTVSMLY